MTKRIVVVEDHTVQAGNIATYLARRGWDVRSCGSAEAALALRDSFHPHALVTDQMLPGLSGIELVEHMRRPDSRVPCIVMTADDREQTAAQAMNAGACEFVSKPVVLEELHLLLERAVAAARLEQALDFQREVQAREVALAALIGRSAPMQRVKAEIRRIVEPERFARDGVLPPVLIRGDTGTGRHLVARALHAEGCRQAATFVEVDCGGIGSELLEAELFGAETSALRGAGQRRTGLVEAAEGGTLFLDEIGNLEPGVQARLLELVTEGTFSRVGSTRRRAADVRVICATSRDLEAMVERGTLDAELHTCLRALTIHLPPLRERGDDIPLLARHFLELFGREDGKPGLRLSDGAEHVLRRYSWPGNVRELRNVIERTVLLATGDIITPAQLALCPALGADASLERHCGGCAEPCLGLPRDEHGLAEAVRIVTDQALQRTGWNVAAAANLLDLEPEMLHERMRQLDLRPPTGGGASG